MVQLDVLATHRYPLGRVGEAFEVASARKDGVIKAVIEL
jgi:threonine dehydrogenase-like Zn-dependent dehydrogenase